MSNTHRIALGLEYVGTNFNGFQRQKRTRNTIQESIESALSKVANCNIKTICSGRTDAGVHAFMQVIHFDTRAIRSSIEWSRGINSYLPKDIRVLWTKEIDESFHARFSATKRSYIYNILNHSTPSALWADKSLYVPIRLDIQSMKKGSKYLIGEHDFSSFRGSGCQSKTPIRNIQEIKISRNDDFVTLEITANAFLLHMVRIIVGTLIMVGKKEIQPKEVDKILKQKNRKLAGKTVSSSGLFFLGPSYPMKYRVPEFKNNLI